MRLSESRSPWALAPARAPAALGPATIWQPSKPWVESASSAHSRLRSEGHSALKAKFSLRRSWDHTAFEHLISDRCRYSVDEGGAHLWIAAQKIYGFLFSLRFRLPSFLPQLLAGRILVFLHDLVGDPVQQWVLLGASYACEEQHRKRYQDYTLQFRFHIPHKLFFLTLNSVCSRSDHNLL